MIHQLHLIDDLAPSGATTQLRLLAGAAVARGDAVTVATLRRPGPIGQRLAVAGVRVLWLGGRLPVFRIDPFAAARLLWRFREAPADVVQSWGDRTTPLASAFSRHVDAPWVATLRGDERRGTAGAKLVLATDENAAIGIDPMRVRIVPNAFEPSLTPADPLAKLEARRRLREAGYDVADNAPVIATLLRIDGPEMANEFAWASDLVRVLCPGVRLLVVGEGPGRMAAERFAARATEAGTVQWLGWQERLDVIYAAADVVWVGRGGSASPTPLVEAMAAGRAVVAAEATGRQGLLPQDPSGGPALAVRWNDRAEWTRSTRRLLDEPALAERLGRENAERVRAAHRLEAVAAAHAAALAAAVAR